MVPKATQQVDAQVRIRPQVFWLPGLYIRLPMGAWPRLMPTLTDEQMEAQRCEGPQSHSQWRGPGFKPRLGECQDLGMLHALAARTSKDVASQSLALSQCSGRKSQDRPRISSPILQMRKLSPREQSHLPEATQ